MKKKVFVLFILFLVVALIFIIITGIVNKERNFLQEGILGTSKPQDLSIFVAPAVPIISIISPENITYSTSTILLNYSITNDVDFVWYNLDYSNNVTITSPLYISTTEGIHTLYLYANNSQGTSVKSLDFSVALPVVPPSDGGGGSGGSGGEGKTITNKTVPPNGSLTIPPEIPPNLTKETTNNTIPPLEEPQIKKISIKYWVIFILVLVIIAIVILIMIIRRYRRKKAIEELKRKNQ